LVCEAGADACSEAVLGKDGLKRRVYAQLAAHTGRTLPWGILTGVKPVKLFSGLAAQRGEDWALAAFVDDYLVSEAKAELARRTYRREVQAVGLPAPGTVSVYAGIPFCPSRCHYCSFATERADEAKMTAYAQALISEVVALGEAMRAAGVPAESVYVGGGTPTALPREQFSAVLAAIADGIPMAGERTEFTVEAGRPETIDDAVCAAMKEAGVTRISVNAQTMDDDILRSVGRGHTSADFFAAFEAARRAGFAVINTDLIAGLPGDTEEGFASSLDVLMGLAPENITLHSLALKRGSAFIEGNPKLNYTSKGVAARMLARADEALTRADYSPYYMYRQKLTVDSLENIGYSKPNADCLYNVRMMQEKQAVLAVGAGAVSKLYCAERDRVERLFNVRDAGLYIERIGEAIERKLEIFEAMEAMRKR
jgi:oxygen-independent coproporphyrinogen-3 oxidase